MSSFAEVILPLPLEGTFTYAIPENLSVEPGSRVIVSFGKKKIYTGVIHSLQAAYEAAFDPKPVLDVLDQEPIKMLVSCCFLSGWPATTCLLWGR